MLPTAMKSTSRAVLLLVCAAACVSAQQVLLQGRFGGEINEQSGLGTTPLIFSWPASSIYASFEGASVNATISALEPAVDSSQYTRFVFYVDQQQVALEATNTNNTVINWDATNLGNGTHNLTITKISEASYGQATLDALTVGSGGRYDILVLQSEARMRCMPCIVCNALLSTQNSARACYVCKSNAAVLPT